MSDVVATPKRDIVAYGDKWLNSVAFKNKAVLANHTFVKDSCSGAYVASKLIAELFGGAILFFASRV